MTIKAQTDRVVEMPVRTIPFGLNSNYFQSVDDGRPSIGVAFETPLGTKIRAYKKAQTQLRTGVVKGGVTQSKKPKKGNKGKHQPNKKNHKNITRAWTDHRTVYSFMEDIVIRPFNAVTNIPQTLRMTPRHLINDTGLFSSITLQIRSDYTPDAKKSGTAIEMGLKLADLVFNECITVFKTKTPLMIKKVLHESVDKDELLSGLTRIVKLICAKNNADYITYDDDQYNAYFKHSYKRLLDGFALDYSVAVACVEKSLADLKANSREYDSILIDKYTSSLYNDIAYKELEKDKLIVIDAAKKNEVVQAASTHAFYDHLLGQYGKVHEVVISAIFTLCKYFHMEPISSKFANAYFSHAVGIVNGKAAASKDITILMKCFSDMKEANSRMASEFASKLVNFNKMSAVVDEHETSIQFTSRHDASHDQLARATMSDQLRVLRDIMTVTVASANGLKNHDTKPLTNLQRLECNLEPKLYHAMIILAAKIDTKGKFIQNDGFQHSSDYKHYYGILNKLGRDLLQRSKEVPTRSHLMVCMDEFKLPVKINDHSLKSMSARHTLHGSVSVVTTAKNELVRLLESAEAHNIKLEMVESLHNTADTWNDFSLNQLMYKLQDSDELFYDVIRKIIGDIPETMNKTIIGLTTNHYESAQCIGFIYEAAVFDMKYSARVIKICTPQFKLRHQERVLKNASMHDAADDEEHSDGKGGGHNSSGGNGHGGKAVMAHVAAAQRSFNESIAKVFMFMNALQLARVRGAQPSETAELEQAIARANSTAQNYLNQLSSMNSDIQQTDDTQMKDAYAEIIRHSKRKHNDSDKQETYTSSGSIDKTVITTPFMTSLASYNILEIQTTSLMSRLRIAEALQSPLRSQADIFRIVAELDTSQTQVSDIYGKLVEDYSELRLNPASSSEISMEALELLRVATAQFEVLFPV